MPTKKHSQTGIGRKLWNVVTSDQLIDVSSKLALELDNTIKELAMHPVGSEVGSLHELTKRLAKVSGAWNTKTARRWVKDQLTKDLRRVETRSTEKLNQYRQLLLQQSKELADHLPFSSSCKTHLLKNEAPVAASYNQFKLQLCLPSTVQKQQTHESRIPPLHISNNTSDNSCFKMQTEKEELEACQVLVDLEFYIKRGSTSTSGQIILEKQRTCANQPKLSDTKEVDQSECLVSHTKHSGSGYRRSLRKLEQPEKTIWEKADNNTWDGLEVFETDGHGKGVKSQRVFRKGVPVCEYAGHLISANHSKECIATETSNECYMYFFKYKGRKNCIDATINDGTFGRLINHSKKLANLQGKLKLDRGGNPRIIFFARRDINIGEELLFDYNDSKNAKTVPWLNE